MDFSQVTIDSSYIKFNDTGFYISSSNEIDISLSYVNDDISNAVNNEKILSFSADTSSGLVWFNLSSFIPGTSYQVKKDSSNHALVTANASGFISFSNSIWSSHDFDIYQVGSGNNPPNTPSSPSPSDDATGIGISISTSWSGGDSDGDDVTFDVYFGTSSNPSKVSSNQSSTSYNPSSLSYETEYFWKIIAWDEHGASTTGPIWSFTTDVGIDTNAPEISNINVAFSNPIDTSIGWENISCEVNDDVSVDEVRVHITFPDSTISNVSMIHAGSGIYYYNSSFSTIGDYTYNIWADDTSSNGNSSSNGNFVIYANWDINKDRACNVLDIVAISNIFGSSGGIGWIREDVDNNGNIQVLDMTIVSIHQGESY